ncbi:TetR/AcrR family transcriptional regulator [Frankia sp. QA3]|uniref:TetR/AcrR family transcriptional regulator n=1 Tax=Frankia sp. QA3 TaxID=710111 RepID=UPI000269C4A8|nr:TetR family transcriptional regulator [Frankia sp. QA3]EIV94796.1 transcriptional regulator [Frankia sp. QA3]
MHAAAQGSSRGTGRGGPRRGALHEAEIVGEALKIIGVDGVEGLTMRRLSDRLGVAVGATYKHVPTKEHLLRLVTLELYARIGPCEPTGADWCRGIRSFLLRFREVVGAYPGMAGHISAHVTDPMPHQLYTSLNGTLRGVGFSPAGAERVVRVLFFYTSGAMLAPATLTLGEHADAEFAAGLDLVLDGAHRSLERDRAATA